MKMRTSNYAFQAFSVPNRTRLEEQILADVKITQNFRKTASKSHFQTKEVNKNMRKALGLGLLTLVLSFFVGVFAVTVDAQTSTPTSTPTPTRTMTPTPTTADTSTPGAPATGFGY